MPPRPIAYPILGRRRRRLIASPEPKPEAGEEPTQNAENGTKCCRRAILVCGVVQGVGFRPFVYRLATEEHLAGSISNDTEGVSIELEGPPARIDAFLSRLRAETPPLARIDSVAVRDLPAAGETGFRIVSSQVKGQVATGIPADAATCPDCLRELLDPGDRRYRYPFLNCTNCGPRFTITRRIPYDRPQTSMAAFTMCPACQTEYDDPLNRRFHAQPNACWQCGPQLSLEVVNSKTVGAPYLRSKGGKAGTHPFSAPRQRSEDIPSEDPIAETIDRLLNGEIAAIKGIGGFHLSVDATNPTAVQRLRQRKHRNGKPLAVMVRDLDAARVLCELNPEEELLLQTPARPIVLVRSRANNGIAPEVAPGIPWLGIFLPYAPLQHLFFADPRVRALVMTSANLSEEPIAIDNDEARTRLGAMVDFFLMHNREILQRCDDSVAALIDGAPQIIRRARGFVPLGVELPFEVPPLLAVGGHLKSVFTLARGRFAYQSQHLGDLENLTSLEFFEESLSHLMHTFEIEPEFVVRDLHPGYLSSTWANRWSEERKLPVLQIQHHHAHIAACMAEHSLEGPVIGLSLDGTGYGTDGKIWGGEVLIVRLDGPDPARFTRFAHLAYVPVPGGEAAVREPGRMALGHLHAAGIDLNDPFISNALGTNPKETALLLKVIARRINTPLTSSCGRLFDAVAALVLRRRTVDYEAQAAIELEGVAIDEPESVPGYSFELVKEESLVTSLGAPSLRSKGGKAQTAAHPDLEASIIPTIAPAIISSTPMWHELLADLRANKAPAYISARFHAGVANAFIDAAIRARGATGIAQVALSGGCLHNRRLARLLRHGLEERGFTVFQHRQVSPGDGGLSYGQAALAAAILRSHSEHEH
jgi:hydrogenase maturation protein HypF